MAILAVQDATQGQHQQISVSLDLISLQFCTARGKLEATVEDGGRCLKDQPQECSFRRRLTLQCRRSEKSKAVEFAPS